MKTLSFLLILFCLVQNSKAQNLKTFNGPFKVGFGLGGEGKATYTYYDDPKTLERTKQGLFSYVLNLKNDIGGTFNKKAIGSYAHGFKNGLWQYSLLYTDFSRSVSEDLSINATGSISLIAPYSNGLPNGNWLYKKRILYRDKHYFLGHLVTTPYQPYEQTTISITFRKGVFSGPFTISSNNLMITGSFDENGRLNGQWIIKTKDNEETTLYTNGLIMNRVNRAMPNGDVIDKEVDNDSIQKMKQIWLKGDQSQYQLEQMGYSPKYRNMFLEKSVDLTPTIFNDLDFMYTTLLGDKLIKVDNEGDFHIDKIVYNGGDFYNLNPIEYRDLNNDVYLGNANSALERCDQEASTSPVRAMSELPLASINFQNVLLAKNYGSGLRLRPIDEKRIIEDITRVDSLTLVLANTFPVWKKGTQSLDNFFKITLNCPDQTSVNSTLLKNINYTPFDSGQQINGQTLGIVYYPASSLDQYNYFQSEFKFGKIQIDFANQKPNLIHFFISSGSYSTYALSQKYIDDLEKIGYQLIFEGYQAKNGSGHISTEDYNNKLSSAEQEYYAPITVLRNNDLIYRFYDNKILFVSKND